MSPNRSNDDELDALGDRLRGLPELPVLAGLEAKLLAAIPDAATFAPGPRRRPRRLWLAGALAAAVVLLAFLLGSFIRKSDQLHPLPVPPEVADRSPIPRHLRLAEFNAFEWPVQLSVPTAAHRWLEDLTD